MCLYRKFKVSVEKIDAWKIFHVNDGKLYSAFQTFPLNDNNLPYLINNINNSECFYALALEEDCESVIKDLDRWGDQYWNLKKNLIILPVCLENVKYVGYMNSYVGSSSPRTYFSYMAEKLSFNEDHFNNIINRKVWNKK